MKGFGHSDRNSGKLIKKKVKKLEIDKLLSSALSLHSTGNVKEASKIYIYLIKNKIYDPRVLINLGSINLQVKQFDKAILLFE